MQRAQIVLACGSGETNTAIAKRMGLAGMTVGKWRKRDRELGRWKGCMTSSVPAGLAPMRATR
ncbi:helix-turn-helix domain-containing protein [Synechococcus sp. CS-1328]|uniref:helix-turn-helix domain-containing protein n=1 Tax=Synechococcus sp. CS-1328 TaxID=2847976 RepID=UPI002A3D16B9|nr:helix-turn-helix domain-containing protein [Synechococcus sp. CS-1328]